MTKINFEIYQNKKYLIAKLKMSDFVPIRTTFLIDSFIFYPDEIEFEAAFSYKTVPSRTFYMENWVR